jgi:hypothetical protein
MNDQGKARRLKFEWAALVCFLLALLIFLFLSSGGLGAMILLLGFFTAGIICSVIALIFHSKEKKLKEAAAGLTPNKNSTIPLVLAAAVIVFIGLWVLAFLFTFRW